MAKPQPIDIEDIKRLAVGRNDAERSILIMAGGTDGQPKVFWGFTANDAREFAAELCEEANTIDPHGVH